MFAVALRASLRTIARLSPKRCSSSGKARWDFILPRAITACSFTSSSKSKESATFSASVRCNRPKPRIIICRAIPYFGSFANSKICCSDPEISTMERALPMAQASDDFGPAFLNSSMNCGAASRPTHGTDRLRTMSSLTLGSSIRGSHCNNVGSAVLQGRPSRRNSPRVSI